MRPIQAISGALSALALLTASAAAGAAPLNYSEEERLVVDLLVQNDVRDFVAGQPTFHFEQAVKERFGETKLTDLDDLVRETLDNPFRARRPDRPSQRRDLGRHGFRADRLYEGKTMIFPNVRIREIQKHETGAPVVRADRNFPVELHFDVATEVIDEVAALHRGGTASFVCKGLPSSSDAVKLGSCRDFGAYVKTESDVMRERFLEPKTDADWLLAYTVLKFRANLRDREMELCRESVARGAAFTQEDVDLILSRNGGLFDAANVEERFVPVGFDVSRIEALVKRSRALADPDKEETRI